VAVRVTVTNTGDRAGDEVVQVYAACQAEFRTPLRSLAAFQRVGLQAGQSRVVELHVDEARFLLTDPAGRQTLHAGTVTLSVGGTQPDARSVSLAGSAPLSATIVL
jgi:beta-glucosidase